ncbi:MAG: helix-turn-helix transcriptional regulator [Pseudomonadota bacterium]
MVRQAYYGAWRTILITAHQIRGARAMLGWEIAALADASGVHRNTITRLESGQSGNRSTLAALQRALEAAGVEFITENGGGPGVRLRKGANL